MYSRYHQRRIVRRNRPSNQRLDPRAKVNKTDGATVCRKGGKGRGRPRPWVGLASISVASHHADRPLYKLGLQPMACQLLMPTTAGDTLGRRGQGGSRQLLQLQQQVGGRCLVRRGGMCHSQPSRGPWHGRGWVHWRRRRPVVNDRITLHYTEMTRGVCTAPFSCSQSLTVTNTVHSTYMHVHVW